ncbi:hypothetical protein SCHPADRAFT_938320 [Schizopora paradoxa]|uniref:Protein kinase domain-containing protein n=1 Tax=Schizopora paradoxa TaxID=27342 RepID=A0A0H2RW56_9AGAM|nr:hypothetical protein SCHPADRAFT_938320 [Schizopora paradoxa]
MDVLGFVINIFDAANYVLKSADMCLDVIQATSDIRSHIEVVKGRANIAKQCCTAIQSWDEKGETIPSEYRAPAENARKAYQEAMSYFQEKIRRCEQGNGVQKIFRKAQYAVKGKERAALVARRVVDTTDTLKHMVDMRVHLVDTSLSAKFRPFLERAWRHSVDAKVKAPLEGYSDCYLRYTEKLSNTDSIRVGTKRSGLPSFMEVVIVECNLSTKEEDSRLLASFLSTIEQTECHKFGLLECRGYFTIPAQDDRTCLVPQQNLVFNRPNAAGDPLTLRELLLREEPRNNTLCARLKFALILTTSLVIYHSLGVVHKCICPESILVFPDLIQAGEDRRHYGLGTPYLLAFDRARLEMTGSGRLYINQRNDRREIYIYPEHLWTDRTRAFETRDDVYGLGICLLEIGLWRSIFKDAVGEKGELYPVYAEWAEDLKLRNLENKEGSPKWNRVAQLVELARKELPKTMGMKYTEAVVACLVMDLPEEQSHLRVVEGETSKETEEQGDITKAEGDAEENPKADLRVPSGRERASKVSDVFQTLTMVPSLISNRRMHKEIERATRELEEEQLVVDEKDATSDGKDKASSDDAPYTKAKAVSDKSVDVDYLSRKSRQNLAFVTDVLKKLYSIRV